LKRKNAEIAKDERFLVKIMGKPPLALRVKPWPRVWQFSTWQTGVATEREAVNVFARPW